MEKKRRSSVKTEHRAITKIRNLIDDLNFIDYHFQEDDKGISFDGTIDLFKENIDYKENWEGSIKVQVKGRTKQKNPISVSKAFFELNKVDLDNFLKADGTILIVVHFFAKDFHKYNIYINPLLPADIKKIQEENKNNNLDKIKIKLKEVKDSCSFEKICRNFKINQDIQKGKIDLINNNFAMDPSYITKFFLWNSKEFKLESLIGSTQYLYTYDSNKNLINIRAEEVNVLYRKMNYVVTDKDKKIKFDDVILTSTDDDKIISFGKSFKMNPEKLEFSIKIQGTFKERVKAIEFIKSIYNNSGFIIAGYFLKINLKDTFDTSFKKLYKDYKRIENFLLKHKIEKDFNFDKWSNDDFKKLDILISSIDDKKPIKFNDSLNNVMIGSYKINDLSLSLLAVRRKDGLFNTYSLWNSDNEYNSFKITTPDNKDIYCKNKYMVLDTDTYLSDDINYEEMKKSFENTNYDNNNKLLINGQVLNLIDAYDINNNPELLKYAKWLTNNLLEHSTDEDKNVYFINYCQILKRMSMLNANEKKELFKIKESSSDFLTKICCNLLLDNKQDANMIIEQLDENALATLKGFPISKYLNE